MAKRSEKELSGYALGALTILKRSAALYDQGETAFYRVMAVELRLLLCDTTRRHDQLYELSLAPRLWPGLALPPLNPAGMFDRQAAPLPLDAWLAQEIRLAPDYSASLRQIIRQVCEQDGGAHVDRRLNAGLPRGVDIAATIRQIARVVIEVLEIYSRAE